MAKSRVRGASGRARGKVKTSSKKKAARSKDKSKAASKGKLALFVATRKGVWIFRGDTVRREWKLSGPQFLGHIIEHLLLDPRDRKTLLAAARTGHLGPTIFRSRDMGRTWKEAARPPAFAKALDGKQPRSVEFISALTPGHADEPRVWYAGTSPHGLFRSDDAGDHWKEVPGFNDHRLRPQWSAFESPPDGARTHSILIDPRDANRMYLSLSVGGFFVSDDHGADWRPLNAGCAALFFPGEDKFPEFGHDPHCTAMHPLQPDRFYQQNHCGIYRLDRPDDRWIRVGDNMPKSVGDIGFPIVLHPRDPDTAWVFPMDGTEVWPRTSPGGKPAVYVTRNAGKTWKRQSAGLPEKQAWLTVFRQAFCADDADPLGLYFGTTSGDVWVSRDEGARWKRLIEHLPRIQSVTVARL